MLNPEFPYRKNQLILTSDRVVLHAKSDAAFIYGKKMVAISSIGTVNIDSSEKILLDSDKIELGNKAELIGDPLILGNKFTEQFKRLITSVQYAASLLQTVSETDLGASMINISTAGDKLYEACNNIIQIIGNSDSPNYFLSKNTFTR